MRNFDYFVDRFADIQVLRYRVPGFESLPLKTRELLYYLYEAALAGRDIIWDQNYRHNLTIRAGLEYMVRHFEGDRERDDWQAFMTYTKRVWFSNGIHHHYGQTKFVPGFSRESFRAMAHQCRGGGFPIGDFAGLDAFLDWLEPLLFDPTIAAKKVSKDASGDMILNSCVNFYDGLSEEEVRAYHAALEDPADPRPPSHGLNSLLVKEDGKIVEKTWKLGGMYSQAIAQIIGWLEKAAAVAETPLQAEALRLLASYYRDGNLATFDAYSIAWLADTEASVDTINGFIETYSDPLDYRGTYEAIVSVKDPIATKRIEAIARNAQWFEDHSPIDPAHKKTEVKGITGSVINVVVGSGDANPASPIGVNLPNADWIREAHGSKSVNLANIVDAYNQVKGKILEEFAADEAVILRARTHGPLADNLHTDLHEVIGHGSGRLLPGVATPKETLRNYSSTLEEARADLVALYYAMDPYLIECGLMDTLDVGKACYDDFMLNGLLLQLRRLDVGEKLEEDHMRNRQLIAAWVLERGNGAIELNREGHKTKVLIHDYEALRALFGQLLQEVQRIKSEGDFEAGKQLVERYGVNVDESLHAEVLQRFAKLEMAAYTGFLNPVMKVTRDGRGKISDVFLSYEGSFTDRMLHYAKEHSFLPRDNR